MGVPAAQAMNQTGSKGILKEAIIMGKCKITDKKGFTLAESLVAILIMLMVSSIMVAGIPAAKNAYDKVILRSNAEMTLSTAIHALRNELSVARDIEIDETDQTKITYSSGTYGSTSVIKVGADEKGILYQRYAGDGKPSALAKLVSDGASDNQNQLYVTYEKVIMDADKNYISFNNLKVCKSGRANPILNRNELSIAVFEG